MIRSWLMVHMCKRILSPGVFLHFFQVLIFRVKSGAKEQKMTWNDKNCVCHTPYLVSVFFVAYVIWLCFFVAQVENDDISRNFFHFQKSNFSGFSSFINKCQKEILRCAPPSSHDFPKSFQLSFLVNLHHSLEHYAARCGFSKNVKFQFCPVFWIIL